MTVTFDTTLTRHKVHPFPYLRSHDKRSANFSFSEVKGLIHEPGYAKITNDEAIVFSDEDILWFEIPMHNIFFMYILKPK